MKTTLISIVFAGELIAKATCAQGTISISNLGQPTTNGAAIGKDSWIAQLFSTGANSQGYALNAVQLLLGASSGTPSGFAVSIYSWDGYSPFARIGTLGGNDPAGAGIYTYTATNLVLSPGNYFVVVSGNSFVSQGAYTWSATDWQNGFTKDPNSLWQIDDIYYSSANGLTWTQYVRQSVFQLAIYATPIPESGTLALLALGGGMLIYLRRRCGEFTRMERDDFGPAPMKMV